MTRYRAHVGTLSTTNEGGITGWKRIQLATTDSGFYL